MLNSITLPREFMIWNEKKYDHISLELRNLHWLAVKAQLFCRDASLTLKCMTGMFISRGSIYVSERINGNVYWLNIPLFKTATYRKRFVIEV